MKNSIRLKLVAGLTACVCSSQAISYHFNVDLSGLSGNPNAPFALDFQLTDGDGVNNSSVSLKNFKFSGGHAVGAPLLTGGASGDLSTSVSLVDTSFFSDLYQGFASGATLSFDLDLYSSASGAQPDGFAFGIGSATDDGASFFDILVGIDLVNGTQTLQNFTPLDGITASVSVPDGGSMANLPMGLMALGLFGFCVQARKRPLNA